MVWRLQKRAGNHKDPLGILSGMICSLCDLKEVTLISVSLSSDINADGKRNVAEICRCYSQTLPMQNMSVFLTIHFRRECPRRGSKKQPSFLIRNKIKHKINSIFMVKEMYTNGT